MRALHGALGAVADHKDEFLVHPRPAKLDQKTSCCVGKRLLLTRAHARSGGCFHPLTDSVLTETVEPDGRTPNLAILAVALGVLAASHPLKKVF